MLHLDEFPCETVDTDTLNTTERHYNENNDGVGACVWTSLKGDWRGASIASRRIVGTEWLRRFGDDLWPKQCMRDVDTQINRFLAGPGDKSELFADIPATVDAKPYVNCAVVGNSYALLGRQLGVEIDSHAQVFRINWPPLGAAYSRDVGQFTTHMITNAASINCNQRMSIDEVPVCRSSYPSSVITLTNWRLCYRFLQLTFGERAPAGQTLLFSPEWVGALQRMLVTQNKTAPIVNADQKWQLGLLQTRMKVSSGLLAVFTALATCQNVDLYGLDGASEFVHSYWEPPRLAGELSETYIAERQVYEMLHNRQLPQKFSKFPLGRVNFRAISSSNIATSIRHQGTEGGPCEAPKFTCSKALLCHNNTVCINPRLPRYNSLQQGFVGGAGCMTKLPVPEFKDHVVWNGTELQVLRESAELPHLLYGVTADSLDELSRFAIAAAESRLLGEMAERNKHKQQQAIEAQLAGWKQEIGNETEERLLAEAARAAEAEHLAHHTLPPAAGGEDVDV